MPRTHIEVLQANDTTDLQAGQLLKVVRETPAFIIAATFAGDLLQISKKTGKAVRAIVGTAKYSAGKNPAAFNI